MIKLSSRLLSSAVLLLAGTAFAGAQDPAGVPNFHQVNEQVFRGAQPTPEGFQNLAKLRIKTVIDLREADSRSREEKKWVESAGMKYVNIPMRGMTTPTQEQISKVLALFNDSSAGPVFVHCRRGADRTGTVVACYRISHDRWDNNKALGEARSLGMSWIERAMQNYVRTFQPGNSITASTTAPAPAPALVPALAIAQN